MAKPTKCAICKQVGGRFTLRGKHWVHVKCLSAPVQPRDGTHKNWPIVTNHVGDPNHGPITINSLRHLRQVEREYGIVSEAYNQNQSNF